MVLVGALGAAQISLTASHPIHAYKTSAIWYGGYLIFCNGIWAEIISQPEEYIFDCKESLKISLDNFDEDIRFFSGDEYAIKKLKNKLFRELDAVHDYILKR